MEEPRIHAYQAPMQVRRRYIGYTALWLLLGVALGTLIALGETCAWLPCRMLPQIVLPSVPGFLAAVGWSLGRTLALPALFLLGLHRVAFHYTSRIVCLLYGLLHGVDLWQCLALFYPTMSVPFGTSLLLLLLMLGMSALLLRVHLLATAGPTSRKFWDYLLEFCQSWGAMLLAHGAFYWLCLTWI